MSSILHTPYGIGLKLCGDYVRIPHPIKQREQCGHLRLDALGMLPGEDIRRCCETERRAVPSRCVPGTVAVETNC